MNILKKLVTLVQKQPSVAEQADAMIELIRNCVSAKEFALIQRAFNLTVGERKVLMTDKHMAGKLADALNKGYRSGIQPTDVYLAFRREFALMPERK